MSACRYLARLPLESFKKIKIRKKFFLGMTLFAGVYQDLAPTAFSGKK